MEKRNILVVDDELLIRDLLYDHFASKDFQITTADSAEQAMEILDGDQQFDVVLTDIKMDGMDGLQLVDHVKRNNADLPVIIMTGFPSLETAIEALRKRVYDYVIKPFNINRLCAVVEAAVNEYQQRKKPALEGVHV